MTYQSISELPSIRDFGGEEFNPLTIGFKDTDANGYPDVVWSITLKKVSGVYRVSSRNKPLTKEQVEAIEADAVGARFPTVEHAPLWSRDKIPDQLREAMAEDEQRISDHVSDHDNHEIFVPKVYWSRSIRPKQGLPLIYMAQLRVDKKDGSKVYLPFTLWSDRVIRRMEPDTKLPLFGLDKFDPRTTACVFMHEGAKAAHYAQILANEDGWTADERRDEHPWGHSLRGVHLGWIGGHKRAADVDWSMLPRGVDVIFVADNDHGGINAVSKISKILKRPMSVVRFDASFPYGFDLADEFPNELFEGEYYEEKSPSGPTRTKFRKGRYKTTSPTLYDCKSSAIWVTKPVPGSKAFALREEAAAEWYYAVEPQLFVNVNKLRQTLTEKKFNTAVAPFSDVDNVARLFVKNLAGQVDTIAYEPGLPSGPITLRKTRQRVVNVFEPTDLNPIDGDPQPFLDFIDHLIPSPRDRKILLRWIATLAARPDIKMFYAVLLISEVQGVGKTTLARICAALVGTQNASFPEAEEVTDNQFTAWKAHKRLVVMNEIYAGDSSLAYNRLKSTITEPEITINKKFEHPYTISNHVHILACSNSPRALLIDSNDRRWFLPGVTEATKKLSYWKELNRWLDGGGFGIILQWAIDYVKKNGAVVPGEEAPDSTAKRDVTIANMSDGKRLLNRLGRALAEAVIPIAIRADDIHPDWLARHKSGMGERYGNDGKTLLERPEVIANVIRGCSVYGEIYAPKKQFGRDASRFRAFANFPIEHLKLNELEPFIRKPDELLALEDHGNKLLDEGIAVMQSEYAIEEMLKTWAKEGKEAAE